MKPILQSLSLEIRLWIQATTTIEYLGPITVRMGMTLKEKLQRADSATARSHRT